MGIATIMVSPPPETNYLRVFMTQIRQRLEPEPSRPRYFITEPGLGFRFSPD